MESLGNIRIVVFDFFGTLARNGVEDWVPSLARIVEEQGFPFTAETLWTEWRKYEVTFRGSRTNMDDPPSSPPFRSYWEAWRDAFADTFAALGVSGDPDEAATICVDSHCTRNAFPEVPQALAALQAYPLAILSNADDRFLDGSIAHNGWSFDPVLSSESAKAYKPDPRIFQEFCRIAGVEPHQVLYVGDSPYDDAHGAKLAGMSTVLVNRSGAPLARPGQAPPPGQSPIPVSTALLAPDYVVETLAELASLLRA